MAHPHHPSCRSDLAQVMLPRASGVWRVLSYSPWVLLFIALITHLTVVTFREAVS